MAIIERRVFYGRIGKGNELIEHIKEGNKALERFDMPIKARVLSDYNSGRTDRVVVEWEMESPGDLDAAIGKAMSDPQLQADFDPWLTRLNELIHYAEAEHWQVQ